jgi:hypothetical protein
MQKFKRILSGAGLMALSLIVGSAMGLAQQASTPAAPLPHERPELGLSQQQKDQIQQIREEHRAKLHGLRSNSAMTRPERRARARELRKELNTKIDAVLTPEQRTKLQHLRQERRAERRAHSPAGGRGGINNH